MNRNKNLDALANRLVIDTTLRRELAKEAETLYQILESSSLANFRLNPADAARVLSMFRPDHTVALDPDIIRRGFDEKAPFNDEGPGGSGGGGCFEGKTLVSTPEGQREIRALQIADLVNTPDGVKKILKVNMYDRDGLVQVDFGEGMPIRCSREHVFEGCDNEKIRIEGADEGTRFESESGPLTLDHAPVSVPGRHDVYELIVEDGDRIRIGARGINAYNSK